MSAFFAEPRWLLVILPALGLLLWRMRRPAPSFLLPSLSLLPPAPASLRRWRKLALVLYGLSVLLLIGALAAPQLTLTRMLRDDASLELMLLLDLSGSMAASDWPEGEELVAAVPFDVETAPPSRIAVAREAITALLASLPQARIGLVAFAGRPYLVCPLLRNHELLLERLRQLEPAMLADGTAIGAAIHCGLEALSGAEGSAEQAALAETKVLLLFSDGADHSAPAQSPEQAAAAAAAAGVVLHCVGIGSSRAMHPVNTAQGKRWEVVGEELDAAQLQRIAAATGGNFYLASDAAQFKKVQRDLVSLMSRPASTRREIQTLPIASEVLLASLLALSAAFLIAGAMRSQLP
jgi:Ca-activated chloride channel family protein